jgi:sodium/hydrogen antiporter
MVPVVYWLVLFSIVWHGLSIPALDAFYRWKGVPPIIEEEPVEIRITSENDALPSNAYANPKRKSIIVHNRFSRPISGAGPELYRWHSNESLATLTAHAQVPGITNKI